MYNFNDFVDSSIQNVYLLAALLRLLATLGGGRGSVSAGGGAVGGRGGLALRHVGGGALLLVARLVLSLALLIIAINLLHC